MRPADAAGGIDLLDGELGAPAHLLADLRIGAGQRRDDADLDGIGGVRVGDEGERGGSA